jgi:hypothetical protein
MADDVREEAERLVAAALAAASYALRGAGRGSPLAGLAERLFGGGPADGPAAGTAGGAAGGGVDDAAAAGWGHFATGTAECCVCPVCRAISALRDPNPEFAARLAVGASDLFAGVTTILRAFQGATARPDPSPPRPRPADARATWRVATHVDDEGGEGGEDDEWPEPESPDATGGTDPWHAATRAPVRPTSPSEDPA